MDNCVETPGVPAQNPVQPVDGRGRSHLPRWLRIAVIGRNPKVTLARAAVLAVLCVVVFKFILLHIRVEGISMLPTYQDGSAHYREPARLFVAWAPAG